MSICARTEQAGGRRGRKEGRWRSASAAALREEEGGVKTNLGRPAAGMAAVAVRRRPVKRRPEEAIAGGAVVVVVGREGLVRGVKDGRVLLVVVVVVM